MVCSEFMLFCVIRRNFYYHFYSGFYLFVLCSTLPIAFVVSHLSQPLTPLYTCPSPWPHYTLVPALDPTIHLSQPLTPLYTLVYRAVHVLFLVCNGDGLRLSSPVILFWIIPWLIMYGGVCYNERFLSVKSECYNESGGIPSDDVARSCTWRVGPSHYD